VGDRRLTARAIARAALATHTADTRRSAVTPAATTGPVPRRVAALLSPTHRPLRTGSWIAALLAVCAVLSVTTAATSAVEVHQDIEVAQGEARG
ncbi:M56 family peptidase, partial [Streptomyces longwoodensis]